MSDKRAIDNLLTNEDFISWVKTPSRERDIYWKNWLIKFPDAKEEFDKAVKIVQSIEFTESLPTEMEYNAALHNILSEIESYKAKRIKKKAIIGYSLKIAASFILLFGIGYLFTLFSNTISNNEEITVIKRATSKGQKMNMVLPDGSFIRLNAESKIVIHKDFGKKDRKVSLEGEAFFEVSPNRDQPFIIYAGDSETRVLGTSFNINAFDRDSGIRIAVKTGLVRVTIKDLKDTINLEENQLLVFNRPNGVASVSGFNDYEELGWKDNILYFKNANFDEIRSKLERWYGVSFETGGLKAIESFSGAFYGESLEKVLDAINYTSKYNYQLKNNSVYVEKNQKGL